MARVRLSTYLIERGELPHVCMRCGAPAAVAVPHTFTWTPQWVGILIAVGLCVFGWPVLIGALCAYLLSKRLRMPVPLCHAHRNHFRLRSLVLYIGLGTFLVLETAALTFYFYAARDRDPDAINLSGGICGGVFFAGIAWLFAAALLQNSAVRASEITEYGVTLIKVSDKFVDALLSEPPVVEPAEDDEDERFRRSV